MKKFISASLTGLLILAFGAIVYAQDAPKLGGTFPGLELKATGWIDAQTFLMKNVSQGNPASGIYNVWGVNSFTAAGLPSGDLDRKVSFWESRMRLKFDWIYGKATSGTVQFEADAQPWGGTPGGNAGQISERNTYGSSSVSADRAALEIKHVYFDFATPYFGIPVPMNFRVGLQPFAIRPLVLLTSDAMGIIGTFKVDPVTIIPIYMKYLEGVNRTADDVDVYGLHLNAAIGKVTVGGYGLYYNMNTYPALVSQPLSTMAGWPAGLTKNAFGTQSANFWWLGLYADGAVGPVNINFDFIYDGGRVKSNISDVEKVKYSGWATRAVVDYPFQQFNFGIIGAYGSGADANKTSASGLAGTATALGEQSSRVGSFVVPPSTEAAAAFGESLVLFSWWGTRGDSGIGNSLNYNAVCKGGLGGLWYAKVYAAYKATPWYKITLSGLYIGDTTKNGNTFGTARDDAGFLRNDKSIGWEADLVQEIEIYKNLKLAVGAGYLWAGDAMELWTGVGTNNHSPNNPWNISTNMTYFF